MESFSLWIEAFSGLGLFLFGMLFLEAQIKSSAGRAFKRIVQQATATRLKSLLSGFFTTAIFQSSSVVTLMALSLIGAQIMQLESAIAVIFGANIGTTVTAWIVALVGFKMDIRLLSYLLIGIGGLGSVLAGEEKRWKNYFGVMVGFGLIFLGLEGMKESFAAFSDTFDLSDHLFDHPLWYMIIGLTITAIIQSSSAAIAIAQSALYTHIIGFEAAAAFVIGANIGTTVTAILGAIGGTPDKKRTAAAHLLFNLSTGIAALILLSPLIDLTRLIAPYSDAVTQIALFHTLFNIMGVVIWYPFIGLLSSGVGHLFKKEPIHVTHYLHNVSPDVPDLALEALQKEVDHLSEEIEAFALLAINIPPPKAFERGIAIDKLLEQYDRNFDVTYEKLYANIRTLEGEIFRYISILSAKNDNATYQQKLDAISRQITYLATAAKAIKDMLNDLDLLYNASTHEEQAFLKNLRYQILKSLQAYHEARSGDERAFQEMEHIYTKIAQSYQNSMRLIADIARNSQIRSEMTTITINDMHLIKSFSKSLRNALNIARIAKEPDIEKS